jgi:hypothetical protein
LFPSRCGILHPIPVSSFLRRLHIRSLNGERGLSASYFPISTLPRKQPPARLSCEIFRWELAITELDWSFAPSPRSEERIARQHPFGPPPSFRQASPCPGLDRSVSSIAPVISGPFRPRLSYYTRQYCRLLVSLRLRAYRPLTLPQKRTPRPVIQNGTYDLGPPSS